MKTMKSATLAVLVCLSLVVPIGLSIGSGLHSDDAMEGTEAYPSPVPAGSLSLTFDQILNTSRNVSEYPLVSRALILPNGVSDMFLWDMNGDGLDDLVASIYASKTISIFYKESDGTFETYPSFNISTANSPFRVLPIDVFGSSGHQVIALERGISYSDTRFVIYNLTSEFSFEIWPDHSTYSNATDMAVGEFSGDTYPDVAVVCRGTNPSVKGKVEVYFGPDFGMRETLVAGLWTVSIASGDFNGDGLLEIAVSNATNNDQAIMIFGQPFSTGDPPVAILDIDGAPTDIVSGRLDGDAYDDLAVATSSPSAVHYFLQSLGVLPSIPDYNISLIEEPSWISAEDINGDLLQDLLILSSSGNATFGHYQRSTLPIWESAPDFILPAGGMPRAASVGDMDGDGITDIAVAGARADWSGPSLSIYPNRAPTFSNSNATAWLGGSSAISMMATGDLNGDHVQDLVTIDPAGSMIRYAYFFQGSVNDIPLGFVPGDLMVADLNLDGLYDIVAVENDGPNAKVVMGSPTFPGTIFDISCGGSITDAALGDFNNDGFLDLVAATAETPLALFNNTQGPIPFSAYSNIESTPPGIWSIVVGDYNSDGMTDLAYTRPIRKIVVMLQSTTVPLGPLSPTRNLTHTEGPDFTKLWSGDVNGDGKTDIVATRPADPSLYLFDQNDFEVAQHPYGTLELPMVPKFVSVIDATDDGHADVVAIFTESDLLYLYRQESGALNATPSMVFVTGADPTYAVIGDGTGDNRGDLLVNDLGSHSVSAWEQLNFAPVANAGGPYFTRQGDLLQINGTVETGTSEIPYMEYFWDFGDGNTSGWTSQVRPVHNYTEVGSYSIQMIARDPAGLFDMSASTVDVLDSVPHTSFSWSPSSVEEGRNVTFTDGTWSFDPVVSRSWSVDGVSQGDLSSIVIAFQNGTHTVVLTVEDADGSVGIANSSIDVESRPPDLELVAFGPQPFGEGFSVTFSVEVDKWHFVLNGSTWTQEPVDQIVSYEWDFSNVPGTFVPDPETPNSANVTHTFSASTDAKVFRVVVRVYDSDGEESNASIDILVSDSGPVAGIQLSDPSPKESVPFTFVSTSASFDGIDSWFWTLDHPNGTVEEFTIDGRAMEDREFSELQDGNYTMSLTVSESDGDEDTALLDFHIEEIAPEVNLETTSESEDDGTFMEFKLVEFAANVTSLDPAVQFEWDFSAIGAEFIPDLVTYTGDSYHSYVEVGNFTVKVRVTDSDGSSTLQVVTVNIINSPIEAGFSPFTKDVRIFRSVPDTNVLTFNASVLGTRYPDIVSMNWDFGDGDSLFVSGVPVVDIVHNYSLGADYFLNVTVTDDDGYTFVMKNKISVDPPEITLIEPVDDGVIRSGTPIMFLISPGSTSIQSVAYDVNDTLFRPFPTQYVINTTGWAEGSYRIAVIAWDYGGNLAIFRYLMITIDDSSPTAFLSSTKQTVYGGDRFNMTLKVFDPNVEASGVTLFIKFPGDKVFLPYSTSKGSDGTFYRVLRVPQTEGSIELYANVTDLAGNTKETPIYTLALRLHFVDWAWPYLLTAAMLTAMGTAGYFMREQKIAVDEVFVIYKDGRMITHSTRRLKPGMDDHVLGGMLVAIQDFVRESFKDITSFRLRRLEFGEKSVLVEKGEHVYLAVLLHGQTSRKIAAKMLKVVEEIEHEFGPQLKDWDGDLEKMRGVGEVVKKFYSKMPMFPGRRSRNA